VLWDGLGRLRGLILFLEVSPRAIASVMRISSDSEGPAGSDSEDPAGTDSEGPAGSDFES